jgi:hypothetical protein
MRPKKRSIFKPSGTLGDSENATRQRIWRVADERMQIRHATGAIPPQLGYDIQ